MDKNLKFKLGIMKSLKDDETRQLQNEVLGHLIELDTPEPEPAQVREVAEAPAAQLAAPVDAAQEQISAPPSEQKTDQDPK